MPLSKEYIIKRVIAISLVVLGVLVITFVITRVIPASPELLWVGPHATREQIQRAREELHLDEPAHFQLFLYLKDFFSGSWGTSWRTRNPILSDILTFIPATLELIVFSFALAIAFGIPLGVFAALKKYSWIDDVIRMLTVAGTSVPVFWLALMAQYVFGSWLRFLPLAKRITEEVAIFTGFKPITGFYLVDSLVQGNVPVLLDYLTHLFIPALVLATYPFCLSARMTRALMIEALSEHHVRALKVWGLSRGSIVFKYALRNAITPVIASLGLSFGYTIIGAFMVELIFVWPGIGYYAAMSLLSFDYPAVIGSVVIVAIFYSVINALVDLAHAAVDPRVKL